MNTGIFKVMMHGITIFLITSEKDAKFTSSRNDVTQMMSISSTVTTIDAVRLVIVDAGLREFLPTSAIFNTPKMSSCAPAISSITNGYARGTLSSFLKIRQSANSKSIITATISEHLNIAEPRLYYFLLEPAASYSEV